MRIALVHDYLREYGGAERVVEALHEMWPEAPLYTSFVDWGNLGDQGKRFKGWDIRTSWVQNNWFVKKYHSPLRFLAPKIWESFDLSDYDVVISSSGWFMCRGVRTKMTNDKWQMTNVKQHMSNNESRITNNAIHFCYIHHPPRNLYGYATGSDLQKYWPVRVYAAIVNFFLRHYDFETAQRVDYFIANSKETARRVAKFYRRESTVIYPPVQTKDSKTERQKDRKKEYFLSVGRLRYSKRVDLAIEAANKLKYVLKIVGTGKEEKYLRNLASQRGPLQNTLQNIEFLGSVSDSELNNLYAGAKALIFCALDEDFGMVPVEAMAHGVPVIALGQGGVLETVVDGKTGVLFDEPKAENLVAAIKRFEKIKGDWSKNCIAQAQKFSKERFQKELKAFIALHHGKHHLA